MQPDYIPETKNSPFGEGGYRDWIPDENTVEKPIRKGKDKPSRFDPDTVTDEDLRDLGINVAKYRSMQVEDKQKKFAKLSEKIEL